MPAFVIPAFVIPAEAGIQAKQDPDFRRDDEWVRVRVTMGPRQGDDGLRRGDDGSSSG